MKENRLLAPKFNSRGKEHGTSHASKDVTVECLKQRKFTSNLITASDIPVGKYVGQKSVSFGCISRRSLETSQPSTSVEDEAMKQRLWQPSPCHSGRTMLPPILTRGTSHSISADKRLSIPSGEQGRLGTPHPISTRCLSRMSEPDTLDTLRQHRISPQIRAQRRALTANSDFTFSARGRGTTQLQPLTLESVTEAV